MGRLETVALDNFLDKWRLSSQTIVVLNDYALKIVIRNGLEGRINIWKHTNLSELKV